MDQSKIWEFFQNNDEIRDAFADALPRYEFLAKKITQGMSVLNIGVGRGGLEAILIKKGVVLSCLDPSKNAIERIRSQFNLGEKAQVGFSQDMPFQNNQFDVVIMTEVLEHLSDGIMDDTLREVMRVLKRGGCIIGTVPANENLMDAHVICPHCGEFFHRWGHLQSFSQIRLNMLLSANNFVVLRNELRVFVSWRRKGIVNFFKSLARYVLGKAGSSIANPSIYFVAKS